MIVHCVQINDALQLEPLAPEHALEAWKNEDAKIWLDLEGAEPDELEAWLDKLGLEGLPKRLACEARDRPGFYPLNRILLLVIPQSAGDISSQEVDHLAFICMENLLLTIHSKSLLRPEQLARLQESDAWLPECSIAALVSALMLHLSNGLIRHVSDLRASILTLEERMNRSPDEVEADEVIDLRSDLSVLGAMVSDQIPCLTGLSATARPFFRLEGSQELMGCAMTNLQATDSSLTWLDHRLDVLRSSFDMHAQEKTNRRLGILTVLSAIFMPVTLMAGIWGMNFQSMPELRYDLAYPAALALMVLIGAVMFRFFRKDGWFD